MKLKIILGCVLAVVILAGACSHSGNEQVITETIQTTVTTEPITTTQATTTTTQSIITTEPTTTTFEFTPPTFPTTTTQSTVTTESTTTTQSTITISPPTTTPTPPSSTQALSNVVHISSDLYHSCAVLSDGTVRCWGYNGNGGFGTTEFFVSLAAFQVPGISNAVKVSTGFEHTCVILQGGVVKCWGGNTSDELGDGTRIDSSTPVQVGGVTNAVDISSYEQDNCIILGDKTIKCWGASYPAGLAVQISGINNAVQVSVGDEYGCAVLEDKTIKCWGNPYNVGQLSDGTIIEEVNIPVQIVGIDNAVQVDTSLNNTCALLEDKTIKCWGDNTFGILGADSIGSLVRIPTQIAGIANAVSVSVDGHICVVLSDNTIKCWGSNQEGQLGDGITTTNSSTPVQAVQVRGINNAEQVVAEYRNTCALLSDNSVKCWGDNENGKLGNDTTTSSLTPVEVLAGS